MRKRSVFISAAFLLAFNSSLAQAKDKAPSDFFNGEVTVDYSGLFNEGLPDEMRDSGSAPSILKLRSIGDEKRFLVESDTTPLMGACFDTSSDVCILDLSSAEMEKFFPDPSGQHLPASAHMKSKTEYRVEGTTLIIKSVIETQLEAGKPSIKNTCTVTVRNPALQASDSSKVREALNQICAQCRSRIDQIPEPVRRLTNAVVQILGASMGSIGGQAQGTGFFVTEDGLLLTNHHVIADVGKCIDPLACDLEFKQTLVDGSTKVFKARAEIYAMSDFNDFALVKLALPKDVKVSALEIEQGNAEARLLSLGYPGDRGGELTFATGEYQKMLGKAYLTSVTTASGASGSPMLNQSSHRIIGLLSHGMADVSGEKAIAQPINAIDSEYKIRDYISGVKQRRVADTISELAITRDADSARAVLQRYSNEKTFLGVERLKELMISHPSSEVRLEILRALEKGLVVKGSSH